MSVRDDVPAPVLPRITDVLVVGAGPAGLTVALSLVSRGREVTIVDKLAENQNRIHHGVADRFRMGPVAIAGDAAHVHSLLGGQGMNAGINDAMALGGAIDAALEWAAPEALDRYAASRRPIDAQIVTGTDLLTRVALMKDTPRVTRNAIVRVIDPLVRQRFAWQLSGLVYR